MNDRPARTPAARIVSRLFWAGVLLDILGAIALNTVDLGGGDAAGSGMEKGFAFLIAIAAGLLLCIVAGLFALVRRTWFRLILLVPVYALALVLLVNVVA